MSLELPEFRAVESYGAGTLVLKIKFWHSLLESGVSAGRLPYVADEDEDVRIEKLERELDGQ